MEEQKKKIRTVDLAYMGLSVALLAVCSWLAVPFTVPVTLQTFAVCLVAGLLGLKRGTLSTLVYILLGTLGVPVFSGFKGGLGVISGPTGGYIIGFILTALIIGFASEKWCGKLWVMLVSMALGILLCYAFGTAWFALVYLKADKATSLVSILTICVFPFLPFDAVKIILAALLTNRLKRYIK